MTEPEITVETERLDAKRVPVCDRCGKEADSFACRIRHVNFQTSEIRKNLH